MGHTPLPHSTVMKRIMVFVQPGMEIVLVPSPIMGDVDAFERHTEPVGKIVMNSKRSLWFELPNGSRIHLAKSPDGKKRKTKAKAP